MALTDEHWKCILERAIPLMSQRKLMSASEDLKTARLDDKAKMALMRAARDAYEDKPAEASKKSFTDAEATWRAARKIVDDAQAALEFTNTVPGQLEATFKENWTELSDGAAIEAWVDAEEIKNEEAAIEATKAALAKAESDLAVKKAG